MPHRPAFASLLLAHSLALQLALAQSDVDPPKGEPPETESSKGKWDFLSQLEELGLELDTLGYPDATVVIDRSPTDTVITLSGGGHVKHQDVDLYAESIKISTSTQDVLLDGSARVYKAGRIFKCDSAIYTFKTGELTATGLRSGQHPLLFSTAELRTHLNLKSRTADVFELGESLVTTHDSQTPSYHLKASKVKVYPAPESRVEMRDARVFIGNRQVFWFPYLAKSLTEELGWYLRPGFRSAWGAYLQGEYSHMWEDHTLVKYQMDARSRRGLAGGVELHSRNFAENENFGRLKLYFADDLNPAISRTALRRRDLNPDRYRFSLQHRVYGPGPEESPLYVDIDANPLSDEFVYADFFPSEFKLDPNPENLLTVVKTHPRGTLSLWARTNANDFLRSDERLPEIALDLTRQPLLGSDFFYEGTTSMGIYREALSTLERDFLRGGRGSFEEFFGVPKSAVHPGELNTLLDDLQAQVDGYSFKRFDTFHQLTHPIRVDAGLSLVPRAGIRNTTYFDIDSGDPEIDSNESRTLLHAGLEGSAKLSRQYPGIENRRWGLDQLRHVIQPYFNYSLLTGDDLSGDVPRIDRLTPSTRLRPIDLSKFTAVDDINPWNIVRLGVRNVLQTKRDGRTHNWLDLNTYVDTFFQDPEARRTHSSLFNELLWHPLPWLRLAVDSQFPVFAEEDFVEINSRVRYMPTPSLEFIVSHRFLNDHRFIGDSNLVNLRLYNRLNEDWGLGMYHRYELDDNTLEIQQYSIHRDLGSWTASLGAMARDHRGKREYGFVFTLSLTDLPRIRLPFDVNPDPAGH